MRQIDRIREENRRYRNANPWIIQNLQNSSALSGRFPNEGSARAYAASYRGGVHSVNQEQKIVYVSEIPSL